jgi:RecA-family ATPase
MPITADPPGFVDTRKLIAEFEEKQRQAKATSGDGRDDPPWPELEDYGVNGVDHVATPTDDSTEAGLGEWDAGDDDQLIPPRAWLLGNVFCRRFVSSLFGDGAVGKTALRYAQYLSLAANRSLTGEHVFQRCRVLIVSLEDDVDELRRRILAARLHHKVERHEVRGWLFLSAPGRKGGKLMTIDKLGRPVMAGLAAKLAKTIVERQIDLVALDPFVKAHSVEENSNSAIDEVAQILSELAVTHNIAVDTPHHTAKGRAETGNADGGRGASAMKDAMRLVYTLIPMTQDEAKTFGMPRPTGGGSFAWTAAR